MSIHSPSHLIQVKKHDLYFPITTARTIIDRWNMPAHLDVPSESPAPPPLKPSTIPQLYDIKSPSHNQSVSTHLYLPQRDGQVLIEPAGEEKKEKEKEKGKGMGKDEKKKEKKKKKKEEEEEEEEEKEATTVVGGISARKERMRARMAG
ncbi:MAG: hypothetical protein ALECFALPRED_004894 [Alectoria fallacina]|uniref:Uncharacterized protein n=1 Tax=Alectoria fallacina TaxID=1903189 RepID=A0A8H3EQL5_9LECA|nr:MAG: hypothetical protein ALECFALPRED_004894 [Alectoria fallacina]